MSRGRLKKGSFLQEFYKPVKQLLSSSYHTSNLCMGGTSSVFVHNWGVSFWWNTSFQFQESVKNYRHSSSSTSTFLQLSHLPFKLNDPFISWWPTKALRSLRMGLCAYMCQSSVYLERLCERIRSPNYKQISQFCWPHKNTKILTENSELHKSLHVQIKWVLCLPI